MREYADGPLLSAAGLQRSIQAYLPNEPDRQRPDAMPLSATTFHDLPHSFIAVGKCDPLRDQGTHYAAELRAANVNVVEYYGKGLVHGSLRGTEIAEVAMLYSALATFVTSLLRLRSQTSLHHNGRIGGAAAVSVYSRLRSNQPASLPAAA